LRSYTSLMDEFSLHNFMIWNGNTLRNTPEFQSYLRTYKNQWSYIESIITQLEKLMTKNCIKLAIISGEKVIHYSVLNLPYLQLYQLLDCVANADQIKPQLSSFSGESQDQILRAAIKIQTLGRRWFAIYRFKNLKKRLFSAVIIQSIVRRYVQRCRTHRMIQHITLQSEQKWKENYWNLHEMWERELQRNNEEGKEGEKKGERERQKGNGRYLIIIIPSLSSTTEYDRCHLSSPHLHGLQNSLISSLSLLHDPRVDIIYVTPYQYTTTEKNYIEKFLALQDITIHTTAGHTNRLQFIVPELLHQLPPTIPTSQLLWYSSSSLRKLKSVIKCHGSENTLLLTSEISWVEKRIATYLSLCFLSSEPLVATEFTSKSSSKRLLMESSVNIPVGAHDIYNEEDLLLSLSRLLSSNLSISRWYLRLNKDHNDNSLITLNTYELPILQNLKVEQQMLINTTAALNPQANATNPTNPTSPLHGSNPPTPTHTTHQNGIPGIHTTEKEKGGTGGGIGSAPDMIDCWYERHVQLNARKRILAQLKEITLSSLLHIHRSDVYPSWSVYLQFITEYGCVIEAEPALNQGRVESYCYISPLGTLSCMKGVQVLADDHTQQIQGIVYPQSLVHDRSLEGATQAICRKLYENYGVLGYVTVQYIVFYDAYDGLVRLWAHGLKFGLNSSYCAIGTLGNLCPQGGRSGRILNYDPLLPIPVEGLHFSFLC
jgi:hypothetical protein